MTKIDEIFGKYLEADGNVFTIKIGKQVVRVKNEDFETLKAELNAYIESVIGEDEIAGHIRNKTESMLQREVVKIRNELRKEQRAKLKEEKNG